MCDEEVVRPLLATIDSDIVGEAVARAEWLRMAAAASDATPGVTVDVSMCDVEDDNKWDSKTSKTAPSFRLANGCYLAKKPAGESEYRFDCGTMPDLSLIHI